MALDHEEVESAIAGIAGVASASVRPSENGRARLRITLDAHGDADDVALTVSSVLREKFGLDVDPASIRPRPAEPQESETAAAPPTAEAAPTQEAAPVATLAAPAPAPADGRPMSLDDHRPVIRDLLVTEEGLGVRARVVLGTDDRDLAGEATAAKTHKATLRAVARATLCAVESLLGDNARLELESLQVTDDGEDNQVIVSITLVTRTGVEKLVGGAVVRGDEQTAALRASLDAVNRRVAMISLGLG